MFILYGKNALPLLSMLCTKQFPNTFRPIPIEPFTSAFNSFPMELWNKPLFLRLPK